MSAGGGISRSKQDSKDLTPGEFRDLRQPLSDLFQQSVIPGFENLVQGFQGVDNLDAFRTPIGRNELIGIENLRNLFQNPSETQNLSTDLLNRTLSGDFLQAGGANPALQDVINFTTQNINEQFNAQDLEARSLFARAGQSLPESSPFAQAQAESNTGRLDAIGENTANILFGAFEAERGRQVQAQQQAQQNAQFEFAQAQEVLQAEALPRLVDQLGLDKGLQEFENRLATLTSALGLATGAAAPTVGQTGSSKAVNASSSIEFKTDVAPMDETLERLMNLVPVTFRYQPQFQDETGDRVHQGLIAEQAEAELPEIVWHRHDGSPYGIHYHDLVAVMLKGMQAQQERIEQLEARVGGGA